MTGVTIAIYATLICTVIGGVLLGMRRGLYKSLLDLGVTIFSIIISFFASKWISKSLLDEGKIIEFFDWIMQQAPDMVETLTPIKETFIGLSNDTNALGMAVVFPVVLLIPLIFLIVYSLISLVLKLPKAIIARTVFGKNSGETYHGGSRIFGAAVGLVAKVLSFVVTVVPIIGYVVLVSNTMLDVGEASTKEIPSSITIVETMSSNESSDDLEQEPEIQPAQTMEESISSMGESCLQARNDYITPIAENPIFKVVYTCGGEWFFKSLSSANVEGEKVSLTDEINVLSGVYAEMVTLLKVPSAEYGEVQMTAIDNMAEILGNAKVAPTIISGFLSYSSNAWLNGEKVFGAEKVIVGDYYEPTLDKILTICSQTTNDTIKEDLHTIGNVVNICIEQGAFVEISNGTPINIPKNEEFMGKLYIELYENGRTRPLVGDMINAFKNYIYRVYNDVNGTSIPYPEQLDINALTRGDVYVEGKLTASILNDFSNFYATVDMNETDNTKFLIQADVRSLGKALDKIERSILFGDSYLFIMPAILRSEGAAQFAFMTPEFAEAMINRKTSMESVLVARQQIAIILSATKNDGREDAIKYILENIDVDSAAVIKETLTSDVLLQFGMNNVESEAMSSTLNSIVDEIAANESDYSEEQLNAEMEAISMIVNTVKGATSEEEDNLFATEEGDYSKSDLTAEQFVETIVESEIVASAIINSSKDEEGELIDDPYKISSGMSASDKESVTNALESYYENNKTEPAEDKELEKKLNAIANILGVQANIG